MHVCVNKDDGCDNLATHDYFSWHSTQGHRNLAFFSGHL